MKTIYNFSLFILLFIFFSACGDDNTTNNNNSVPAPPQLTNPPNGSIDSIPNPTFNWTVSSGATSYLIQIATDTAFLTIINENTVNNNSYTLNSGIIQSNTTYYWHVKGLNEHGAGNFSPFWSFHTVNLISIVGTWKLIRAEGQLDVCPGEKVTFPHSITGIATLFCPGNNQTILRAYNLQGNILTYTETQTQYNIYLTGNELKLTGINNNRILTYLRVITVSKISEILSKGLINSSE